MGKKELTTANQNIVAENLKRIRKMKRLSQRDLSDLLVAEGCNISSTGVSKIEQKKRKVYDHELACLSMVLEVDINEFFRDL